MTLESVISQDRDGFERELRERRSLGELLFFDDARRSRERGLSKLAHLKEPLMSVYKAIWMYSSDDSDAQLTSLDEVTARANALRKHVAGLPEDKLDHVLEQMVPESFALVYLACKLLKEDENTDWYIVPHPVQLLGGLAMRATGKYSPNTVIDMKTGEGKTITSTLPVFLHALTGRGVHVMTHNDALAQRDVEDLAPLYELLGVSTALVDAHKHSHKHLREEVHDADVVYGSLHQFGFSTMADQRARDADHGMLRRPYVAFVDEADSVMIDDAATPMVLNNDTGLNLPYASEQVVADVTRARDCARLLDVYHRNGRTRDLHVLKKQLGADAVFDRREKTVALNDSAYEQIRRAFELSDEELFGGSDVEARLRNAVLAELHEEGRDYMIADHEMLRELGFNTPLSGPQIVLIDERRHRPLPGQKYQDGLHQAIEAKHEQEGVRISRETVSSESLEIQQFLKRYPRLAGMTGTGLSAKDEFRDLYGCSVAAIPRDDEDRRVCMGRELYASKDRELEAVADFVKELYDPEMSLAYLEAQLRARAEKESRDLSEEEREALGYAATTVSNRPMLIGTSSVEETKHLEQLIRERIGSNARIQLLSADSKRIAEENAIIAGAGRSNTITIATNMAGRGIDIKLDDEVRALGGLFVIGTEAGLSERVEQQLVGRCGRQGDPGAYKVFMSLDDRLFAFLRSEERHRLLGRFGGEKTKYRVSIEPKHDKTEEEIELYVTRDELKTFEDELGKMSDSAPAADPRDIKGNLSGRVVLRALKRAREHAERHYFNMRQFLAKTGVIVESYRKQHLDRRSRLLGEVVERDPYSNAPYHSRVEADKPQVFFDLVDAVGAYVRQLHVWADRLEGTEFRPEDMVPCRKMRDGSDDRMAELDRIAREMSETGREPRVLRAVCDGDLEVLRTELVRFDERAAHRIGDAKLEQRETLEGLRAPKYVSALTHDVIDGLEQGLLYDVHAAYMHLVAVYGQEHADELVRQSLLDEYDAAWTLKLRKSEEWKSTVRTDQQSFDLKSESVLDLARNMDEIDGVLGGRVVKRLFEYARTAERDKQIVANDFFAVVPKLPLELVEEAEPSVYLPKQLPKKSSFWHVGAGLSAAALAGLLFVQIAVPGTRPRNVPVNQPIVQQADHEVVDTRPVYELSWFDGRVEDELRAGVSSERERLLRSIAEEYVSVEAINEMLATLSDQRSERRAREAARESFSDFAYGVVRVEGGRFVYDAGPNVVFDGEFDGRYGAAILDGEGVRVVGPQEFIPEGARIIAGLTPDVSVAKRVTLGEIVEREDLRAFAEYVRSIGYVPEFLIAESLEQGILPVDAFEVEYEYAESYDLEADQTLSRARMVRNSSVLNDRDRDLADARRLLSESLGVVSSDGTSYTPGPVLLSAGANMYEVAFWHAMQVLTPKTIDAIRDGLRADRAFDVQLSGAHAIADRLTVDYRGHLSGGYAVEHGIGLRAALDRVDREYGRQWFERGPFHERTYRGNVVEGVLFPRDTRHRVYRPDSVEQLLERYDRALSNR